MLRAVQIPLGEPMKAAILAVVSAMSLGSVGLAGGPVIVVEEDEIVAEEKPASSVGILPLLLIPVALCIVLCAEGEDPLPN